VSFAIDVDFNLGSASEEHVAVSQFDVKSIPTGNDVLLGLF
jgi:hypothetical protein